MAIKIKKTVPKAEAETDESKVGVDGEIVEDGPTDPAGLPPIPTALSDDKVLVASRDVFDWMAENRMVLLGGVAALVLGMLVFSTVKSSSDAKAAQRARDLYAAVDGVVVEESTTTMQAASEALRTQASALATGSGELAATAAMLGARASATLGDGEGALAGYQAFAAAHEGPEAVVARFGVATAHAQAGRLSDGLAVLEQVAENEAYRPAALTQKAVLLDTFGTPEQALEAWRAAAATAEPGAFGADTTAANRARALEIQLGVEGSGEDAAAQ